MINRLFFTLTLAALAVLCVAIWQVLDAPVRRIVIAGELTSHEREELTKVLSDALYEGVLSTDLDDINASLAHLPWAKGVSVRRQWPDEIEVRLSKARPVARWGDTRYLSAYGDLLSLPDAYPGLPLFDIAVGTPQEAMEVYRLLAQIAAREAFVISRLAQNAQAEWRVEFAQGPAVLLGSEQLNQRMHRFLLVHRRVLADNPKDVVYVDARYTNGVAVRYEEKDQLDQDLLAVTDSDTLFVEEQN